MSRPNSQVFNLSQDQQDLLMAALTSNQPSGLSGNAASKVSKASPIQAHGTSKDNNEENQQSVYNGNNLNGSGFFDSPDQAAPGSGDLNFDGLPPTDSPFLDFDPEADDQFDFGDLNGQDLIGDLPDSANEDHDLHEKRKSVDGKDEDDEGGGKRRESEDKISKKPGRKPLMNEPTSKRKAQNRAAQRAFRERKEKHLKDLETKVEDLEKSSEAANHENGLLKAQVERLQVELREYRKRLSWASSGSSLGRSPPLREASSGATNGANNNNFQFDFPKFGDLPNNHMLGRGSSDQSVSRPPVKTTSSTSNSNNNVPGVLGRNSTSRVSPRSQVPAYAPATASPVNNSITASPKTANNKGASVDSLNDLFSPSILAATRNATYDDYFPQETFPQPQPQMQNAETNGQVHQDYYSNNSTCSNSDSPNSSTDSQQQGSSIGTSPEPSLSSPNSKLNELGLNTINEEGTQAQQAFQNYGGERSFCDKLAMACGDITNPIPRALSQDCGCDKKTAPSKAKSDNFSSYTGASSGFTNVSNSFTPGNDFPTFNSLAEQNNYAFNPELFNDYRDPQDAIVGADFGSFFNEAFPLPDLGSPFNNLDSAAHPTTNGQSVENPEKQLQQQVPPKVDLMKQVEAAQNGEEVYPAEDRTKMMTCNKIWYAENKSTNSPTNTNTLIRDRLQSMDKFRNGEIDVDNLCSELRSKARCSEGGAVVHKNDVDTILGRAR
ncbi:MAG: hypothetical protein Q9227_005018 [Pyrenula ochraceoflavens]